MYAQRMGSLPPYLFARIDAMKAEKIEQGVDIIDLGVGDPDLPTPPHIVEALCTAARDPKNHHYPSYAGLPAFRSAVADWFQHRFNVTLDPKDQILSLMGSKDGIAHIPEAFVNPGDVVGYGAAWTASGRRRIATVTGGTFEGEKGLSVQLHELTRKSQVFRDLAELKETLQNLCRL